ncbi:hypothetical protein B0H13DRAFT_2057633 [Mycena leptocephala]|nr:hypothetical protein B0H13DRAFT_2057633 [Mycena leptocephala]
MSLVGDTPTRRVSAWAKARNRLEELNKLIDALLSERQKIADELGSIVYPVLTLPNEITSFIFTLSLPERTKPTGDNAPLLLTQVCRSWRAIAFATPSLWQSITLHGSWGSHIKSGKLLDIWLRNSATLPLFLSFGGNDAITQSLIDSSLSHHLRWREIELSSRTDIETADVEFPILRKVTLMVSETSTGHIFRIQNAPMLHEAFIRTLTDEDPGVQLPWAQLTKLIFETFGSPPICLRILRQCSDLLLHLTYRSFAPFTLPIFYHTQLTLNNLNSLEIEFIGSSIVPHLTLPRLRELTLSGTIASAIEPFRALFSRSCCSLQRLSIIVDHDKTKPESLLLFFQLVPTVVTLTLELRNLALHQAIDVLFSTGVLPVLKALTIDARRVRDEYDSLLDVLRSRRENNTLQAFSLTLRPRTGQQLPSPFPELAMAQFRDLAHGGLQSCIQLKGNWRPLVLLDTFA